MNFENIKMTFRAVEGYYDFEKNILLNENKILPRR